MRSKYFNDGVPHSLSAETRQELGLTDPNHWTVQKLLAIQPRIAEPLILYW